MTEKNDSKRMFVTSGCMFLLFLLFIWVIITFDVQAIGPLGTQVGLATVDGAVSSELNFNAFWYHVTEISGDLILLVALGFALLGFVQLVKRKNLLKVDHDLLLLGGLYVSVILAYLFFEQCIINYRPVLLKGEIEASFPSSHTLLAACVMTSAIQQFSQRIKGEAMRKTSIVLAFLLMAVTIGGRVLSGVHWLTDIIGSLLLSAALLYAYFGCLQKLK